MDAKYLFLGFVLILCANMSHTADITQGLENKFADLRNGKSVSFSKDELVVLLGKSHVQTLLQAKSVREIELQRKHQYDTNLVLGGICIGGFGAVVGGLIGYNIATFLQNYGL